jgi:3-(3-hydroxy-phenyl)propionate hydroxylase
MALTYDSDGATIQRHSFDYQRCPDQDAVAPVRHPVVVVGAGPVGLSLAIDLAQRGQPVLLLDNDHRLSTGSRAICFAKRALEIWDRLGVGEPCATRAWNGTSARCSTATTCSTASTCCPSPGTSGRPSSTCSSTTPRPTSWSVRLNCPASTIRWQNKVVGCTPQADGVLLDVDTPDGRYQLQADYLVACDGSRSPLRGMLGQESKGRVFQDRFLIADVRMQADFPAERWFWFDPPFHPNQSVLLHRQPDNVWRIDFQLGWDADPEAEKQPERIKPRVDAMMRAAMGRDVRYELEWASVYTFACLRMDRFVHGRVLFAGDAAHGVSPFGARGANSACRTPTTWPGSSTWCCAAWHRARCSTPTGRARVRGRREPAELAPAPPTSSRPRARSRGCSAMPRWPGAHAPVRPPPGQQRPAVGAGHAACLAA